MMTPRDVFGLAVRIVGLLALVYGVHHLITALGFKLAPDSSSGGSFGDPVLKMYAAMGAGWLLVGSLIIAGAGAIVNTCYPAPSHEIEAES